VERKPRVDRDRGPLERAGYFGGEKIEKREVFGSKNAYEDFISDWFVGETIS
jgi:hypothetical protein